MKTKEKCRKYKVEYLIYFLKADKPGPSYPYRKEMVLEEKIFPAFNIGLGKLFSLQALG